jgi:hypothetical protein
MGVCIKFRQKYQLFNLSLLPSVQQKRYINKIFLSVRHYLFADTGFRRDTSDISYEPWNAIMFQKQLCNQINQTLIFVTPTVTYQNKSVAAADIVRM